MNAKKLIMFLSAIVLAGCMKEDFSECGISLKFEYDCSTATDSKNMPIDKAIVYVFNDKGIFVNKFDADEKNINGKELRLMWLLPGIYDFVVWGNLGDDYDVSDLVPDLSVFTNARVSLKTKANREVDKFPDDLYHGSRMKVEVKAYGNETLIVPMVRDTKYIRVNVNKLPFTPANRDTEFVCYITSSNGDYDFNNEVLPGNQVLTYLPKDDQTQIKILASDFCLMRLFEKNDPSRLILEQHPLDGSPQRELMNINLVEEIIKQHGASVDFKCRELFILNFDAETDTNGNVFAVGSAEWTPVTGGENGDPGGTVG